MTFKIHDGVEIDGKSLTNSGGTLTWGGVSVGSGGGVSISSNANNRVLTGDGSNAVGETNLTFDGTNLQIVGSTRGLITEKLRLGATDTSFIERDSTVNIGYRADGVHRFWTYNGSWLERAQITDSGLTVTGSVTAGTSFELPSSGMLDWANGDARIVEGLVNNYSLSFQTWDGSTVSTALRLDGNNAATFSGTISSGAITSSGYGVFTDGAIDPDSFTSYAGGFGNIADGGGWAARGLFVHGGGTGDAAAIAHNGNSLYFGIQNGSATNSMSTWMEVSPAKAVTFAGSSLVTLPGTISSPHFSTASNINSSGSGGVFIPNGKRIGFDQTGTRSWTQYAAGGNLLFASGDGNGAIQANNFTASVSYELNGSTVINSSRGLTNITSGNIAGNLTIDYTGNATNDAGLYVANDNNDWGIYVNKDGTATYGIKIAADGSYPFQITNSSGTEKFRVNGSGSVVAAGNLEIAGTSTLTGTISSGALAVSGQSVFTGAGTSNTYQSVIKTVNSSSDQWGHITLSGAASNSVTNNYYLIGRGNSVSDRQMSFHIPTASNYGSGSEPIFRFASSGSDTLMSITANTGATYIKGNITLGGTVDGRDVAADGTKLDGIAASANNYVLPATVVIGNSTTAQPASDLVTFNSYNDGNSTSGDQSSVQIYNGSAGEDAFVTFHVSGDYAGYFGLDGTTNDLFWGGWSVGNVKNKIFHAGNSAQFTSALNTKLAGIATSANNYSFPYTISIGSSNNSVVRRDGNGYIFGNYLNMTGTFANSGAGGTMSYFTGTNGSDNYGRSWTAAQARTALNVADGANAYVLPASVNSIQTLHIRGDEQTGYSSPNSLVGGISLWSTGATTSQIMFKPTSSGSLGNHGFCTDSYNTYFVMDTTNRGWVFRNHTTSSNMASISNTGGACFSGTVQIGGNSSTTEPYSSAASGARLTFGGANDVANYHIGTSMENVGGNYTKLDLRWHTGIRMGAQPNYGGVRIFDSEDMGTLRFSVNNGSADTVVHSGNFTVSAGEISNSNYALGYMQNGALNVGRTDTNYAWSGTTWATDVKLGMLLNCSETYEIGVHDSGDSVDSFMKYNGTDFEMGNNLGWGTTTFAFASSITAGGNITAYASDKRLKENIKPIDNALEKVMKIRGVEFDWTDEAEELGFEPKCKHETGVIAQEIEEVIPDAIAPAPFNKEYKTVEKDKIVALLIEAIKEQQKQIDELKEKLESK